MRAACVAIGLGDVFRAQNGLDGPGRDELGGQQKPVVEMSSRELDVVYYGEDGACLGAPVEQDVSQFFRGKKIEPCEGFIEKKDIGALCEGPSKKDPLLLGAGELTDLPWCEAWGPGLRDPGVERIVLRDSAPGRRPRAR